MTDVAIRQTTDLSITPGQDTWTEKQKAALTQLGVKGASNADLAVFFHYAARTGLDPFARQLYLIERQGKQTIQTGIDGFRLVARRAADRAGEGLSYGDPQWAGPDGVWTDVWLSEQPPMAAKASVYRGGQAFTAVVLWREFAQLTSPTWKRMPAHMLSKVAEVAVLRKAFPQDLSGLYSEDEPVGAPAPQQASRVTAADVRRTVVVEAEREPDEPAPPGAMTDPQRRKLFALLGQVGLAGDEQRDACLAYLGDVVGRELTSRGELTSPEADKVITALELDAGGES